MDERLRFGKYTIRRVDYEHLENDDLLIGAILTSKYVYENRCSPENVKKEILDREGSINIFVDYSNETVGFFQAVPLAQSSTLYLAMSVVTPEHRENNLRNVILYLRLSEAIDKGYQYCVGRTGNPLVVDMLNKSYFRPYIPEIIPNELLNTAKSAISEYKCKEVSLNRDMIISDASSVNLGMIPVIQESSNSLINQFMKNNVNVNEGKRLIMIRENDPERDLSIINRYLSECIRE